MTIDEAVEEIAQALRRSSQMLGENDKAQISLGFLTGVITAMACMHPEIKLLAEYKSCRDKES